MLDLIGSSVSFGALLDKAGKVAPLSTAVLLQGETGTGKEVVARAIHQASPRRDRRFVALNCAAIPIALMESELFGHEKGAFTGAVTQVLGRFQAADGGTLFLDEVGDLPLELQAKFLRVLQEQQFERLGSARTQQVDVRIVAATNQDLHQMVQERRFRADLYYRLNVFPITLPPLRERRCDIPQLALHFAQRFATQQGKTIDAIPEDVVAALEHHDWPGNIRELQNVMERGVILTTGRVLTHQTVAHLAPVEIVQRSPNVKTLAEAERAHILATLHETNWVIGGPRGAASQLGLPRTSLISRMQRLGIAGKVPRGRAGTTTHRRVRVFATPSSLRVMEAVAG